MTINSKKNIIRNKQSKIIIGTAQLGLKYGIANKTGKMKISEIKKIKNIATNKGVNFFETAHSYGSSEKILGSIGMKNMNVITKLPLVMPKIKTKKWLDLSIQNSMKNLKIKKLYAVMIHNSKQLNGKRGLELFNSLSELKKMNKIKKIGVAVYTVDELKKLLKKFKFDLVSIPYSVFDERFTNSGLINRMKKMNIDIYARSIFLQGLLLMKKNERPKIFKKYEQLLNQWDHFIKKNKLSKIEYCLNFVLNNPNINKVILGFDNHIHFKNVLKSIRGSGIPLVKFNSTDTSKIIDARKWKII